MTIEISPYIGATPKHQWMRKIEENAPARSEAWSRAGLGGSDALAFLAVLAAVLALGAGRASMVIQDTHGIRYFPKAWVFIPRDMGKLHVAVKKGSLFVWLRGVCHTHGYLFYKVTIGDTPIFLNLFEVNFVFCTMGFITIVHQHSG